MCFMPYFPAIPADDLPAATRLLDAGPVAWLISDAPVPYPAAVAFMERRIGDIHDGRQPETVWLLQHPPLYTAGTSARDDELLDGTRFPVYRSGRGGRFTYHGPGQRVVYVLLDLRRRGCDVRAFVSALQSWAIDALARLQVTAEPREGRVGLWVASAAGEAKIAAIGVRVRRWVTYHGLAINVDPDLSHFRGIVPCGLPQYPVTSLAQLNAPVGMAAVDAALEQTFVNHFGVDCRAEAVAAASCH
jgi:lipoyl(octanoyl) transferase